MSSLTLRRGTLAVVTGMTVALGVTGCSGAAVSEPADIAAASSAAAAVAFSAQQWCSSYSGITDVLSKSGVSQADTDAALKAVNAFDGLWVSAGEAGYVTQEEVDANRRVAAAFGAVVQLVANGAAPDSAEVGMARTNLQAVTDADTSLIRSSTNKVVALCSPFGLSAPATSSP